MSGKSNTSNNETIVTNNGEQREKAKNIVDAHAEISRYSVLEMNGGETHERMFAWDQVIEFFAIGFKIFFAGFIVSLFMVPVAVAVNFGLLDMYGGRPNIYDKIFIFILAFSMTVSAVLIIIRIGKFVEGPVTYKMLKSLYTGAIASTLVKGLVLFVLFQFLATLITPQAILAHLDILLRLMPNANSIAASAPYEIATILVGIIKPVFRISAVIMAVYSVLSAVFLGIILLKSKYKLKAILKQREFINKNVTQ